MRTEKPTQAKQELPEEFAQLLEAVNEVITDLERTQSKLLSKGVMASLQGPINAVASRYLADTAPLAD